MRVADSVYLLGRSWASCCLRGEAYVCFLFVVCCPLFILVITHCGVSYSVLILRSIVHSILLYSLSHVMLISVRQFVMRMWATYFCVCRHACVHMSLCVFYIYMDPSWITGQFLSVLHHDCRVNLAFFSKIKYFLSSGLQMHSLVFLHLSVLSLVTWVCMCFSM